MADNEVDNNFYPIGILGMHIILLFQEKQFLFH